MKAEKNNMSPEAILNKNGIIIFLKNHRYKNWLKLSRAFQQKRQQDHHKLIMRCSKTLA
jgi:hypothetical protein